MSTSTHANAPSPQPPHGHGGTPWRASYTPEEVAVATGISRRSIGYAIERGDLIARYPSSRPVVLHADLITWLETAPTTRANAPSRPATTRAAA